MGNTWNHWYHCTAHVYGAWLRGDPRGWRARHHREHVDGDYKNPPPKGKYDHLYEYSKSLMTRDCVRIEPDLRGIVLGFVLEKLEMDHIPVQAASLDGTHLHLLAQFNDDNPRHWLGRAKKSASHCLRQNSLRNEEGGLWGKRSHAEPVTSDSHFQRASKYVLDHQYRGAAVWTINTIASVSV